MTGSPTISDNEYFPWFNSPLYRARPKRSNIQYIEMEISASVEKPRGISKLFLMLCAATMTNRSPYLMVKENKIIC